MPRLPLARCRLPLGFSLFGVMLLACPAASAATLLLTPELPSGPIQFAAAEISAALIARGETVEQQSLGGPVAEDDRDTVILATEDLECVNAAVRSGRIAAISALQPEGFSVRVGRRNESGPRTIWIVGHDAAGAMYGGLEVAERIRLYGRSVVVELDQNPYLAERGVKFNLPLDARSPSYSDASDTAQENIGTVWQIEFWREFIDRLARNRYNLVSVWNLHPFPSMVRVPEYPEIALADVQRSRGPWKEHHALQATGLDPPELLAQVETLRHLSIDEKIAFWREVMRYGLERNVKFYLITWNIFTNGTAGKYGVTPEHNNPVTVDYFRRSVRELLLTYPDLAGIGFTAGENMPDATAAEKEDWGFRTYGQGILDALALQPARKITFVHRQHEAASAEIARHFAPLLAHPGVNFVYSFKYAEAHALSSTRQTFHRKFLADIGTAPLWTLRNDDSYFFRWGAPGFVREFVQHMPAESSRGFYYGSDQWIWGRDFTDLTRDPAAPRPLELVKHWYHWLLWGRLGYDASLSDDRLVSLLEERFPQVDARTLFAAWQDASMIYPLTTGFHWGALDFQWYIEGCQSRPEPAQTPTGFHDINRFITLRPHPATDNLSIPDYVAAVRAGESPAGTTPLQVAERLQTHAARARAALDAFATGDDSELRQTTEDIRAMAHLGDYYGHKIRAATHLALGRTTPDPEHARVVAAELNQAAYH